MSIEIGDSIPNMTLKTPSDKGPADLTTDEIFSNKKVVIFAVPGAFTPTCSMAHLPGFVVNADKIKAKGVDTIVCTSVNDAFVMGEWSKSQNAENLVMLADGNGEFASAIGLTLDGSGFGMGTRSKRYAMIVDNGIVQYLGIDEKELKASSAEAVLEAL